MYDLNDIIDDLGIGGVVIFFVEDGVNACVHDTNVGFIFLELSSLEIDIVAHELRHFYQWTKGLIRVIDSAVGAFIVWGAEAIHARDMHRLPYSEIPWEVDAVEYENQWRRFYSMKTRKIS